MYQDCVYSLANRCLYLINIQIMLSHQRRDTEFDFQGKAKKNVLILQKRSDLSSRNGGVFCKVNVYENRIIDNQSRGLH